MLIDIDIPEQESKIALHLVVNNELDGPEIAWLTQSSNILHPKELPYELLLNDASLKIFDEEGILWDSLIVDPNLSSQFNIFILEKKLIPEPGKTYSMIANSPGLPTVTGSFTAPLPVKSLNGNGKFNGINPTDSTKKYATLYVNFEDPNPDKKDYFLVQSYIVDQEGEIYNYGVDQNLDYLFYNPFKTYLNEVYSDELAVNGEIKTVFNVVISHNLQFPGAYNKVGIRVSSITEDEFRFNRAYYEAYNNELNPFAEPVNVPSNILNGFGLFAGRSHVSGIFEIK